MDQFYFNLDGFLISQKPTPIFEFHISKEVRKKYGFNHELFSINGNVVFADFKAVRSFVQKINFKRNPSDHVAAGQVNGAGLIDEIFHYLLRVYEFQVNPGVFSKAIKYLNSNVGEEKLWSMLYEFVSLFPPKDVYLDKISVMDYLNGYSEDRQNAEIVIEEMIMLHLANFNPANKKLIELFDDNYFSNKDLFNKIITNLDSFFQSEKKFGPDNQDIFTLFKTPILMNPDNIEAQLDFINEKWKILIDEKILRRILSSKDLIKEDFHLQSFGHGGGGAPTAAPVYLGDTGADFLTLGKSGYKYAKDTWKDFVEPENFTPDVEWMPNVVLMAKNSYVWLDQLSKKYKRSIKTLDQVPDEELNQLSRWGFNGLWLIGIWERSNASKKIKHLMGNMDAVASAYSLYDYTIAWDLGGEEAYNNLNYRARMRGIRLASDMVPNHTGIFSKWIAENPNYFIQTEYSPFPNYSFNGPDLSDDSAYQIRIEDGYWNKTDASVVFQRIDNRSGEIRYIYHGNDGTNMPWNDTAQLDMLNKEVREAVMGKIFDVARKFSIIRFDAAMTLTKRHFSRLWYPEPGKGGDIPTRSDFALTHEEFDHHFPNEFWREVVDRINEHMPETLLLAEAFWLLEGYFVRSLGMHRVYNSAFMHMMMKEENEKYRDAITNTLEFEPEILKRYVNFMSNPDEETAIKQFGTDDKYFGVTSLMLTLPGLPMFAHGQIEGYTEKYGMEYQRAYYHEEPHQWLIDRHEREIFPLIKRRYLFSEVTNFWFFDFINGYGSIDENVFAFTNAAFNERALVFYNNKYQFTSGSIKGSVPKLVQQYNGSKSLETRNLADALNINGSEKIYYLYKENVTKLEYIRSGKDIVNYGFKIELDAFKYRAFIDFKEIYDVTGEYEALANLLNGAGVANLSFALAEMKLKEIHNSFEIIFTEKSMDSFVNAIMFNGKDVKREERVIQFLDEEFYAFLDAVKTHFDLKEDFSQNIKDFESEIRSLCKGNLLLEKGLSAEKVSSLLTLKKSFVLSSSVNYRENSVIFMIWLTLSNLKKYVDAKANLNKDNFLSEMLLDSPVKRALIKFGRGELELNQEILLLSVLMEFEGKVFEYGNEKSFDALISNLNNEKIRVLLGVNEYQDVLYYSKENFEDMINWMFSLNFLEILKDNASLPKNINKQIIDSIGICEAIKKAAIESEYKLQSLINLLEKMGTAE